MLEHKEPSLKFESYSPIVTMFVMFIMVYGFYSFVSDTIDFIIRYTR